MEVAACWVPLTEAGGCPGGSAPPPGAGMHTWPGVEPPAQSLGKVGQLQSGSTSQMSAEQADLEQAHPFLGRDSGPCLRLGDAGEHTRVHTRAHAHMHAHTHTDMCTHSLPCASILFFHLSCS